MKAIAKNVVLPVAALGALLVVLAAPEASLSAARGLFSVVAAHPVACSALILAAAGVALSPYLLLVAAVLALVWGVPKLPPPLRPRFLQAPIAAEARAALEAAKEKLRFDSYFIEGGGGRGGGGGGGGGRGGGEAAMQQLISGLDVTQEMADSLSFTSFNSFAKNEVVCVRRKDGSLSLATIFQELPGAWPAD